MVEPGAGSVSSNRRPRLSERLERALRFASEQHEGQVRRGSKTPYVEHVVAVSWILDRAGFEEDTVIAGLLHDTVEDTAATLEEIAARFGEPVAAIVSHCSEIKNDSEGRTRPWIDRKRDHLAAVAAAPAAARAVILADKLHNLLSIAIDLREGRPIWSLFHADREQVLWYHQAMVIACAGNEDDPRLSQLAESAREAIAEVERL
jgi:(p)ppGpp synthase/HD superfamily hydrolase